MKTIIFSFFILLGINSFAQLINYTAPEGTEAAPEFELEVNGQPVFVYNTRCAAFAIFSFNGTAEIKVTYASPVYNFDIRPKSRNILAENYRNQISFTIDKPENLLS